MRNITHIIIHCADTKPSMTKVDVKEIDRWHRMRGFTSIGYHFVIKRNGNVETGRPLKQVGAHVQGHNSNSIGICLAGGLSENGRFAENNFTADQMMSLKELVDGLKVQFPDATVCGHRDMPNVSKECPCFDAKDWYQNSLEKVKG